MAEWFHPLFIQFMVETKPVIKNKNDEYTPHQVARKILQFDTNTACCWYIHKLYLNIILHNVKTLTFPEYNILHCNLIFSMNYTAGQLNL